MLKFALLLIRLAVVIGDYAKTNEIKQNEENKLLLKQMQQIKSNLEAYDKAVIAINDELANGELFDNDDGFRRD